MRPVNSKGQALAEFILVIPLFFVVMLGVIQFSLLYFAYQMVHYASFTAARAAIVRPCAAFQPDDAEEAHFTPAVFTAATLATMAAMPPQCLLNAAPPSSGPDPCGAGDLSDLLQYLPGLRHSSEVEGLGFAGEDPASWDLAWTKFVNAAAMTSVQRVENGGLTRPMEWTANPAGPGPGIPCDGPDDTQRQNVPAPGRDLSLEVTLVYPMTVPFVNRVIFGIFVNFTDLAQDRLHLGEIHGDVGGAEDVMVYPTRPLAGMDRINQFWAVLNSIFNTFGYSEASKEQLLTIAEGLAARGWYPVPVRARCTLTTEGAMYPLVGPPTSRGW